MTAGVAGRYNSEFGGTSGGSGYGRGFGTRFGPTDFVALAGSFGAAGFRVSETDEFRPTLERVLALGSPAVIEIPVDYRDNLPLVQPMRLRAID